MSKGDQQYLQQMTAAHSYGVGLETRFSLLYVFFYIFIFDVIFTLPGAIQQHDMRRVWINVILFLLIILGGFLLWRFSLREQKVIVADEGVIYTSEGYTVYTPWENILRATLSPYGGLPALQLHTLAETLPIEQGIRERRAAVKMRFRSKRPVKVQSRYEIYNYIPLTNNRESGLWQDVRRHLPDLEMAIPAEQGAHRSTSIRIF